MPIEIPESASQVENRAKTDVQRELPSSNPFLKNSWLGALITGYANRVFDFYIQLRAAIRDNFPDTALGLPLEKWAAIWGKQRLPSTQSTGNCVATGTAGGTIPSGTTLTASGESYTSTSLATISLQTINVSGITRSGSTATATTQNDHGLANNVLVTITGADQAEYNVTDSVITVTGLDTFQYEVLGSPATPATGTISASHTSVSVPIKSDDFGADTNLDAGTQLRLQSPLVDVDDILTVDFGEVGGGSDEQTDDELREVLLDRIQNPVAHFNEAEIIDKAREVAGVTRVFVKPITPDIGQVTIFFMRDNDTNPIPSASEVATVKTKILEITPVNTDPDDVIVSSPSPVSVGFVFSALSPDTQTMRSAIEDSLGQFFQEGVDVSVNIDQDAYRSAIFNTVDTATGDSVSSFELSSPVTDVAILTGEIGVLGSVVFNT